MRSKLTKILGLLSLVGLICQCVEQSTGENVTALVAVEEPAITSVNTTVSEAKTKRTCACDDNQEALVCASNGITYKNNCRFNCAKARVSRLRIVKQGQCQAAAGAGSYWQKGFKG